MTKEKAYELHAKTNCKGWAICKSLEFLWFFQKTKWICVNCGWSSNGKH